MDNDLLLKTLADHRKWQLGGEGGTRADLTRAVLTGADLRDAVLTDADLRDAVLTGAVLRGADLRDADLRDAVLTHIRDDFFDVLDSAPNEVPALRAEIVAGRINGSTYGSGAECSCLVGTIANAQGVRYDCVPGLNPNADRHAERWFLGIRPGDTPENSQISAITMGWLDEWMAKRAQASDVEAPAP